MCTTAYQCLPGRPPSLFSALVTLSHIGLLTSCSKNFCNLSQDIEEIKYLTKQTGKLLSFCEVPARADI